MAAVTALSLLYYTYVVSKKIPGADQTDKAKMTIAEKAKECGQYVQRKADEDTYSAPATELS